MILIASAVGLMIPSVAIFLVLRTFQVARTSADGSAEEADLSWRDYRSFHRLLDPADFNFLRRQGFAECRIKKLRVERRKIYRLCLRSVAQDFNQVHRALSLCIIHSQVDRPELAAELTRQRIVFCRNLLCAEFRLMLHGFGLQRMPEIDFLRPLEMLQVQLQMLAPSASAA